MIIQYDVRPDATIDEKLRSLIESIQLALGEVGIVSSENQSSEQQDISAVIAELRELGSSVSTLTEVVGGFDGRLSGVETSLSSLDDTVGDLQTTIGSMQTTIQGINDSITDLDERVSALEHPTNP